VWRDLLLTHCLCPARDMLRHEAIRLKYISSTYVRMCARSIKTSDKMIIKRATYALS
jgi:hypothetical protein